MGVKSETERILSIPQIPETVDRKVPAWVRERCERPGGTMSLFFLQLVALHEAFLAQGLLGSLPVGSGKTLLSGLLPHMFDLPEGRDAHLFVPASAVDKTYRELAEYDEHFYISRRLWVHSYGKLSNIHTGPDLLNELQPGLLLFDECHKLANSSSVSWVRVMRWMQEHQDTRVCAFSGTPMKSKLEDMAHIAGLCLRQQAPVPLEWIAVQPWSKTLSDDTGFNYASRKDWRDMQPLVDAFGDDAPADLLTLTVRDRREHVREAFRHRLDTTRGVVLSRSMSSEESLTIEVLDLPLPDDVANALEDLEELWMRPDGEFLTGAMHVSAAGQQLSQGFHYYWDWPDGEVDTEWLAARAAFNKAVAAITRSKRYGKDSPGAVYKEMRKAAALLAFAQRGGQTPFDRAGLAAAQPGLVAEDEALWASFEDWAEQREKQKPPTLAAWVDRFVIEDVVRRIQEADEPTLVWYSHSATADALEAAGLKVVRPKESPCEGLPSTLALSIKSHATGLNLQGWSRSIVLCPPGSNLQWEQLIGRQHRTGQKTPVMIQVYGHTKYLRRPLEKAFLVAQQEERTKGAPQKLTFANWKGVKIQ